MALKIMPHGRLQEWVADEKGFFTAEGLEYSFLVEGDYGIHTARRDDSGEIKTGAFETFEDLHPEAYKHYHLRAVPEKYRDQVDVRAFGTGERIVFLAYTREVFDSTRQWAQSRNLFPDLPSRLASYDEAVLA